MVNDNTKTQYKAKHERKGINMHQIYEQLTLAKQAVKKCDYKDIDCIITLSYWGKWGFYLDSNNVHKQGDLLCNGMAQEALRVIVVRRLSV